MLEKCWNIGVFINGGTPVSLDGKENPMKIDDNMGYPYLWKPPNIDKLHSGNDN